MQAQHQPRIAESLGASHEDLGSLIVCSCLRAARACGRVSPAVLVFKVPTQTVTDLETSNDNVL